MHRIAAALSILLTASLAHAVGERGDCRILKFDKQTNLLATTQQDCTIGYALDTDIYYLRIANAWSSVGSVTALVGANSGTFANGTNNVWTLGENSEDLTLTASANLWTLASSTGATFALTPATTISGDLTLSGGAGALTFNSASSSIVTTDNAAAGLVVGAVGTLNILTLDTRDAAEGLGIAGYLTVSTTLGVTGVTTLAAGAGALTFTHSSASVLTIDNDTTALDIGSADLTSALRYSSANDLETFTFNAGVGHAAVSVTGAATLDASDCGKPIFVTAAHDGNSITLPALTAVPAGCIFRFHYVGADGGALLDISPNASDGIEGSCTLAASVVEFSGTDDADVGLTKATIKKGDTITIESGDADDWYASAIQGICANN